MDNKKKLNNINNKYDRVIVLIDMDCFYCQVEEKHNPNLKGKPIAVVQYNAWKGGGIIAVNYPARAKGVTRHMRGDEAKEHCPDIELVRVPNVREKADLTKYREAGKEVAEVLQTFTSQLERASVDEAYLDITERVMEKMKLMDKGMYRLEPNELLNTYAMGYDNIGKFVNNLSNIIDKEELSQIAEEDVATYKISDIKLLVAASIVNQIRATVKEKTGYECSAGIAHNKILSKLACGLNKPNKQTLLPLLKIPKLLSELPLNKIKGLGGKFGEVVSEKLKIKFVGDLLQFSEQELQKQFDEKNGTWLYLIGRGIDLEMVTPRLISKSIGCCKKFPGRNAITSISNLTRWLSELANEIAERLEKDELENQRKPKQMTINYGQTINNEDIVSSRTIPLTNADKEIIAKDALETIKRNTEQFYKSDNNNFLHNPIIFLGISVGKFENIVDVKKNKIQELFNNHVKKQESLSKNIQDSNNNNNTETTSDREDNNIEELEQNILENNQKEIQTKPSTNIKTFLKPKSVESINKELEQSQGNTSNSFFKSILKENVECIQNDNNSAIPNSEQDEICDIEENNEINKNLTKEVLNEPQPSTSKDYINEYVEFYRPPITELDYTKCSECGKQIPENEYQSHLDYHFACNLSQQQRIEFREEIKNKIKSIQSPKVKSNKKPKISSSPKSLSIEKFLTQKTVNEIDDKDCNSECAEEMCNLCGKMIRIDKVLEHSDYHFAKNLQSQINTKPMVQSQKSPILKSNNNKKRKISNQKNESIVMFLKKN